MEGTKGPLERLWLARVTGFFVLLILLMGNAAPSEAGLVYGRVFRNGQNVSEGMVLEVLEARGTFLQVTIVVGQRGRYSVNLPPGTYRVRPRGNPRLEGRIVSDDRPVGLDIFLRPIP